MPAPPTKDEYVEFTTRDGFRLNLIHVKRPGQSRTKPPVILVHGAGVRAEIFRPPTERTLVDCLLDEGYDVWLENWRASIDFAPNSWTLDQAAVFDHPKAVETVIEATGAERVKAIIHCQGSTSFMMSAVAGLIPQVDTIVSNAVSLFPVVPESTKWKMRVLLPLAGPIFPFLNPQWGLQSTSLRSWLLNKFVQTTHWECRNAVCKQSSFTYGVGYPTLWLHKNLDDTTHEWVKEQFGHVPMTFFQQIARGFRANELNSVDGMPELPQNMVAQPPQSDARMALFAGAKNRCFLAKGQVQTFDWFNQHQPDHGHSVDVIPEYGHLDIFMGKDAATDVFPTMIERLGD